jgi:hypothetical protein
MGIKLFPCDFYGLAAPRASELDAFARNFIVRHAEKLVTVSTPDFHPARPPVENRITPSVLNTVLFAMMLNVF